MDDFELAHEELELVGAHTAITDELCARVAAASMEIARLTEQAELLRQQIEDCWNNRVRSLMYEHELRLKAFFPTGIPDNCQLAFETLSGLVAVDEEFARLLRVIHNAVPDYPDETRERYEPD